MSPMNSTTQHNSSRQRLLVSFWAFHFIIHSAPDRLNNFNNFNIILVLLQFLPFSSGSTQPPHSYTSFVPIKSPRPHQMPIKESSEKSPPNISLSQEMARKSSKKKRTTINQTRTRCLLQHDKIKVKCSLTQCYDFYSLTLNSKSLTSLQ